MFVDGKKHLFPAAVLCFSVALSQGFNVGLSGAKIFSGAAAEQFGYSIQQFSNSQGKWLLVGSPWKGSTQNRKGDVYKCDISDSGSGCQTLNLQNSVDVTAPNSNNINMSLGLSLTRTSSNNGFMTCGPLWAQQCGSLYFYPGVCAEVSPQFSVQSSFSPAIQTCSSAMDLAIVLDGSNSIYPWEPIVEFLKKLLQKLDIGPQTTQVTVMQYAVDTTFEFKLKSFQSKEAMIAAASKIQQKEGLETNTFHAIDFARKNAFLPSNGGRAGATKVMVVVTDGESHDSTLRDTVIKQCDSQNITRFGIAVLGYYLRNDIDTSKLITEIKSIATKPTEKYFFNVSEEAVLIEIVGTLGDRIFNIEGVGKSSEDNFKMEMSEVGISTYQTKNKDVILLGAAGAYDWSGTVVHRTSQKSDILPKVAFEKVLEDRNHSSLLGYSVSTLSDGSMEFFVAGAPRAVHRGQVVVYTLDSQKKTIIVDSQRGDQIGSYFGSVLCPVDVDADGVTDLLLVGAPMYMSEEKFETGRVYLFSITKGVLSGQGVLEGSQKNARFGMAIAVAPDLNLDGFSDVVVGAPLDANDHGVIYVFYGDRRTISKQSSQKILGNKVDPGLKFFGRSLDCSRDMNGDSLPDVSVGAFGKVVQLWSKAIAVVTAKVSFIPDKISILSKTCRYGGRAVSCSQAHVCFSAAFKPSSLAGAVDVMYNLTLDADLQSSRASSRAYFSNRDRVFQKYISITSQDVCEDYDVYVQETPDLVSSISLRVDVFPSSPDADPVLDVFSPNAWVFFIPFSKDCGADETCFCDLVLSVESEDKLGSPLVVAQNKRRVAFTVTVMNRKENAYNARVSASYSNNLFYSSVTPLTDGTEVKCTLIKESLTCQVSYPALRTDQSVTFLVNFEFNLNQLQKTANIEFEALSDSTEETPADNKVSVSIPVQYNSEIILSKGSHATSYLLEDNEVAPMVRTFKDIGQDFNFHLKVSTRSVPISLVYLTVWLPTTSKAGNPIIYVTSVKTSPDGKIYCTDNHLIDVFKIRERPYKAQITEESFRGTSVLNCKAASCQSMQCMLKDLEEKSDYYVNVTSNIWKETFVKADFHSVDLVVKAEVETSQPDLLFIEQKQLQVEITVSNPRAPANVPMGVIVGSVIGGLLLLAAAVAVLWKLGFFKRKYHSLMNNAEGEAQELQENHETTEAP